MNEILGTIFIIVGLAFDFLGCFGLLRMPDVYNRLQASTKCVTLGTCGILLGTFLLRGFTATGIKAILCIIFILLTAPVSAHALARGAHRSGVKLWEKSVCDKYQEDREGV
ncbi:MAG: monovalent cation/H(+) antiporter subunit G [Candidatus Omnitrophica bacterium]|nr:monovalent cation/H(+) antiporter subunit G [Candidatus Omnitrophota bacterium]MCM8792968.1 monovalent cation/H(+) antiporter subunit G [Candidatus Omnitrophota bacterium]